MELDILLHLVFMHQAGSRQEVSYITGWTVLQPTGSLQTDLHI